MLFTAHCLPERVLVGDPYPDQLRRQRHRGRRGRSGSTGGPAGASPGRAPARTPEPWRGPDVLEVIRDLAATGRADGVLVCPQGFVADHLEVLYDLDIEAAGSPTRSAWPSPAPARSTTTPTVLGALADRVLAAASR